MTFPMDEVEPWPDFFDSVDRVDQWHRQVITDGRAQHGHTALQYEMLRKSAEARHLGGSGHVLLAYGERMRLVILWIYIVILRHSISRPFST